MPRRVHRVRPEGSRQARFLTFSCYRRLPLLRHDTTKDLVVAELHRACDKHAARMHAWVVMPEHVHLLVEPADGTVSKFLMSVKTPVAKSVIGRWRALDAPILARITDARGMAHFWQRGGGYDRNIYTWHELNEKIRYIHDNPVRRGLAESPIEWRWSSAAGHARAMQRRALGWT